MNPNIPHPSDPKALGLWTNLRNRARPLISALCALSSHFALISLHLNKEGLMIVEIEPLRHSRRPKAAFNITDEPAAQRATVSFGSSEKDGEALRVVLASLQALFNPHKANLLAFLDHYGSEHLSLTRSLAMDENLPGGVERYGEDFEFELEDALADDATRPAALLMVELLSHPEHPLSHVVGALISDFDSSEIQQAILECNPTAAPIRQFTKRRTL